MSIRTLDPDRITSSGLRRHITYTTSQLKAEPLASPHVSLFEALRLKHDVMSAKELTLLDALSEAKARVDKAGRRLIDFGSLCSKTILTITHDKRDHALYTCYFGDQTLSEWKRAKGEHLRTMRGWLTQLETSDHLLLKALAAELTPILEEANAADETMTEAELQKKLFRENDRRKLFDEVNAARKSTHGELAKLPHIHVGLPSDFADSFFLKESHRSDKNDGEIDGDEEPVTIESVEGTIAALMEEVSEQEELLAELKAQKKAEEDAALAADKAALAEIERAIAEHTSKAAALKVKIATASGTSPVTPA